MGKPVFNPYGMDPGFRYMDTTAGDKKKRGINCPKCQSKIPYGSCKCPVCNENVEELFKIIKKEEIRTKKTNHVNTIVLFVIVCILLVVCLVFFSKVPA